VVGLTPVIPNPPKSENEKCKRFLEVLRSAQEAKEKRKKQQVRSTCCHILRSY
jgi:ubiquitin